jgi:hypothetical protein
MNKETCIANMKEALTAWGLKENVDFADIGLSAIYDEYKNKKHGLIDLLSKNPDWDAENLCVVKSFIHERTVNKEVYRDCLGQFVDRFWNNCRTTTGGHMDDYAYAYFNVFQQTIENMVSSDLIARIFDIKNRHHYYMNSEIHKKLDNMLCNVKVGMKMSRLWSQFFDILGVREQLGKVTNSQGNEVYWFDRWFAQFSDSLNPRTVSETVVLSVNPCDYINMSKGTGWQSCHNMCSGSWRAGCISYMLDDVSMVLYTIDKYTDKPWAEPKINRQMYMYNFSNLLSSRLYPDYADTKLKSQFDVEVLRILSECERRGVHVDTYNSLSNTYRAVVSTSSGAKHYLDYTYSQYNTLLYFDTVKNNCSPMFIGARTLSLISGTPIEKGTTSNITGDVKICYECGRIEQASDMVLIGEKYYCKDCAFYCSICGVPHLKKNTTNTVIYNEHYICDNCYNINLKTCQFCNERDFKHIMLRGRTASGKFSGKYAHKCCIPDNYGICACGTYQKHDSMQDVLGHELCPACTNTITTWITNL